MASDSIRLYELGPGICGRSGEDELQGTSFPLMMKRMQVLL